MHIERRSGLTGAFAQASEKHCMYQELQCSREPVAIVMLTSMRERRPNRVAATSEFLG